LYDKISYPWELHLSCGAIEGFLGVTLDGEVVDEGEAKRERGDVLSHASVGLGGEIGIA
jgi:hypothetical protein